MEVSEVDDVDLAPPAWRLLRVEQNAEKGLAIADRGFVPASGEIKVTGTGTELLNDEEVGRLYLGG
ncbi:hypothetical protein [Haloarcula brevis]|uniref:hypothetical protein n=1 Tax=Haloarcula brevis TaxID=3111453 RepID=UPI00300E7190